MVTNILDLCKEKGSVLKVYLALCAMAHTHNNKTFQSSCDEIMKYSRTGRVQTQHAVHTLSMLGLVGRRIYRIRDGINRSTLSWYRIKKILTPYPQIINMMPF